MPRDIPVGNGDLLIAFDEQYRVRDLYFPQVGRHNHTVGHVQRFGVWADGEFAWIEEDGWTRELRYKPDTLVTDVRLVHEGLGLELTCHDAVDFNEPIYSRRVFVRDLAGRQRDVRLFTHLDFSINGSPVGDTANYDPSTASVVLYKDDTYFLINGCDEHKCGIDHWAIGTKRVGGAEGTWRDAEDGQLGRNAISQGSVDATVGFNLHIKPHSEAAVTFWIACGHSYDEVKRLNARIHERTPERLASRTEAYWKMWALKEPLDLDPLPERLRDLYIRSQLVLRTQIDNGGAIIAATDSDITHFAGDHYCYCWPRDGALVAHGLITSGQSELSRGFFRFSARCIEPDGYFLHKYTPEGRLASSWHPWMLNGQKILPIQQDETSLVLWALRRHFEEFRDVEFIKPLYSKLVARPAEWMLDYRDHHGLPKPSWDLWEERRGVHTFTVAATIGALDAASKFAHDFGEPDRAVRFAEGAERMRGALKRHLWSEDHGRFARMAIPQDDGSYRLDMTADSANYAVWAFGALEPTDELARAEMTALENLCRVRSSIGGYARYQRDYYHQIEHEKVDEVPGNPWVICTLWQAHHQIECATTLEELRGALEILEWCADRATLSGCLAEQYHPYTGEPISVSPLTWSHATYVIVAKRYLERFTELNGYARRSTDRRQSANTSPRE